MPIAPPNDASSSQYPSEPLHSSASPGSQESYNHPANVDDGLGHTYEPPSSVYNPSASTYEPPPSYAPYDPEEPDNQVPTEEQSPKKKKSFMNDDEDDDFAAKAAAVLKDDKARKDRQANEAFRKAAEADGMIILPVLTKGTDFLF